jgi:hypothetical protein
MYKLQVMWEFEREKKLSYIIGMLATQLDTGAGLLPAS